MGKEQELLKATRSVNKIKIKKLLQCNADTKENKSYKKLDLDLNCYEPDTHYTPLILAVLAGEMDLAELYLEQGANVNAVDNQRNTALHYAAFKDRFDLVDILVKFNADAGISNKDGNTPLHIVCQSKSGQNIVLVLKLLQNCHECMVPNNLGYSPLDIAAMLNHKDIVLAILENRECTNLGLAFVESCIRGHMYVVQLLLQYGANPNEIVERKDSGPLHEALRFFRYDTVRVLINSGADMTLPNTRGETPQSILDQFPRSLKEKFNSLIIDSSTGKKQAFVPSRESQSWKFSEKEYPVIKVSPWWTNNSDEYCNSCTESNPNTNVIDGNPCTFWVMPRVYHAWTIFDLQSDFILTGFQILGWNSPLMVKTVELQKAARLSGPWISVKTCTCQLLGSQSASVPGTWQEFHGFYERARYWRIFIYDNHGGNYMSFQGVGFFGADARIVDLLNNLNLSFYTDLIIQMGWNTYPLFVQISKADLRNMLMNDENQDKLMKHLAKEKLDIYPMKSLVWIKPPVNEWKTRKLFPEFLVGSNPCVTETLEITIMGIDGSIAHQSCVELVSHGEEQQSVACFNHIAFDKAGLFKASISSSKFPHICLQFPSPIMISEGTKGEAEILATFDDIESMLKESVASLNF